MSAQEKLAQGGHHQHIDSNRTQQNGNPFRSPTTPTTSGRSGDSQEKPACIFDPTEHPQLPQHIATILHNGQWHAVLQCPCDFPPDVFRAVMLNLIRNPNLTSTHLFRADILYDSDQDRVREASTTTVGATQPGDGAAQHCDAGVLHQPLLSGLARHLKCELQPWPVDPTWPGFSRERTIVRQFVPRNPLLDRPIAQTCHILEQQREKQNLISEAKTDLEHEDGHEHNDACAVIYIPHVQGPDDMPFYHPTVSQLCFLQTWDQASQEHPHAIEDDGSENTGHIPQDRHPGTLTILYRLFPSSPTITPKLSRIALRLLQTIHKHGQGLLAGYEKRVLLDQIIPQKRYQDTYARLKAKYGRQLSQQWVEVTDPGKHVFEDIGIAAFLIELWRESYALPAVAAAEGAPSHRTHSDAKSNPKPPFPGFVDIGCGNGVLVYLLLSEGFPGWGFDARRRKTWAIFPPEIQAQLKQHLLVPDILVSAVTSASESNPTPASSDTTTLFHNGLFDPPKGTFIISNHADELTAWTPLLAYRNAGPFIAIPCCSHDLAGTRFRAPPVTVLEREREKSQKRANPLQNHALTPGDEPASAVPTQYSPPTAPVPSSNNKNSTAPPSHRTHHPLPFPTHNHAAETGDLRSLHTPNPNPNFTSNSDPNLSSSTPPPKPPSAYATLCSYIASLAREVGFVPELDTLRIPSTRNTCIVGRRRASWDEGVGVWDAVEAQHRACVVAEVVRREMKAGLADVAGRWVRRGEGLRGGGSGAGGGGRGI